jgi:hypothetical protein
MDSTKTLTTGFIRITPSSFQIDFALGTAEIVINPTGIALDENTSLCSISIKRNVAKESVSTVLLQYSKYKPIGWLEDNQILNGTINGERITGLRNNNKIIIFNAKTFYERLEKLKEILLMSNKKLNRYLNSNNK